MAASRRSQHVHRDEQVTFFSDENIGKCPSAEQTLSTIGQTLALLSALFPFCLRAVCRWSIVLLVPTQLRLAFYTILINA
jgi:hypothetical protein